MYAVTHSRQFMLCALQTLLRRTADIVCSVTQQSLSAASHGRYCQLCHRAANVTQQTLSALPQSRHCRLCHPADSGCCVTQQILPAVSHSRQCHTADIICCVTQQTLSAVHTAGIVCKISLWLIRRFGGWGVGDLMRIL